MTKIIPKKKKRKEANWLFKASEKSANRRDTEGKEKGKDILTQLNAEFQRTRRDNNALLNEQCKEIKKNNRMGN